VFAGSERIISRVGDPILNGETGVYSRQRLFFPNFPWVFLTSSMYLVPLDPDKSSAMHMAKPE